MTRRVCLVFLASCGLVVAGCSSAPLVRETRDAPTGIGEGEDIAMLLASYGRHRGVGSRNEEVEVDRAEVEQQLDACLRREMLLARNGLRFIDPHALRYGAFPDQPVGEFQVAAETMLRQLIDARGPQHAALTRLRYAIVLDGTQWDSGPRPQGSGTDVMGVQWEGVLSVRATVLDLAHRRIAGSVSAYARGERAAGVAVLVVLPIPFFFTTMPEAAEVCTGLGRALARFIAK